MRTEDAQIALYWKNRLQQVGRTGAILVLTNYDEELLDYEARYLPFFMMFYRYTKLYLISDNGQIQDNFISRLDDNCASIIITSEIVSSQEINDLLRVEGAFGIFYRLYSDTSIPLEEHDYYELVKFDHITLNQVAAYCVLHLEQIPTEEELIEAKTWMLTCEDRMNYVWDNIRSFTDCPEFVKDGDLVIKQREIISESIDLSSKNIYLYADSAFVAKCIEAYQDYNVVGIIDRDDSKIGADRNGVPILGLDKLDQLDFVHDVLLITNVRCEELVEHLVETGAKINKDFFVLNLRPEFIDWSDDNLEAFVNDKLGRGYKIYNHYRHIFPKEKFLLSPPKASGDIYVAGMYFEEYIKNNCPNGARVFVSCTPAKKVANLMGYDAIQLPQEDMNDMLLYIRYNGFGKTNALNTNFGCLLRPLLQRNNNLYRIVDTNTAHQRIIFKSQDRHVKVELSQKNSDKIFEENHLRVDRTILFVPYAYTFPDVPYEHGSRLVEKLTKMGYDVCTNVAGDEEPIEGTRGVFVPYDQVLDFANKCAGVIGIRNGLFDIISSSESKMVIYYPKSNMLMYGLEGMGLKMTDILEMIIEDNDWDEIVDSTIDFFKKDNDEEE